MGPIFAKQTQARNENIQAPGSPVLGALNCEQLHLNKSKYTRFTPCVNVIYCPKFIDTRSEIYFCNRKCDINNNDSVVQGEKQQTNNYLI